MRHRKSSRQLGRNSAHRRALFRNLVTSLMLHERIETTEAKGKEIRALSDQMISLGIQGDLSSRRAALAYLQDPKAVLHLFSDVAPLFKAQGGGASVPGGRGGYTRLIKTRLRYGDAAPMVIVELTKRTASSEDKGAPSKAKPSAKDKTGLEKAKEAAAPAAS